jgi:capsular exopolysaccharide synthesis family protein
MENVNIERDYVNLKRVFDQLISHWVYFAISLTICVTIALFYLKTTLKLYEVKASLQLRDESLTDKGTAKEKFISGLELMEGDSELEDEIGVLSSYSMIERALKEVNFTVSYFNYFDVLGPIGKKLSNEVYSNGFYIEPDYTRPQVVDVPIYIDFPDEQHYHISVDHDHADLFDLNKQQVIKKDLAVSIDQVNRIGEPFIHESLSFSLKIDTATTLFDGGNFFKINSLESLTKDFASKLKIATISKESNIVDLVSYGGVPEKEIDFINSLANVYIENDFQKKNQLGIKTIEFIDRQLNTVYDSLTTAEGNLESFRTSNQIIDISITAGDLNTQLQALEQERAQLKIQQEYFRHTLSYIRKNESAIDVITPSSVGINDPFLNTLLIQLSELNKEKIDKSYSSKENNPVIRVIDEKIDNTKKALMENIENLINSTDIALQENQRRVNRLQIRVNSLPQSERDLINIQRKFSLNDNIYNYLLQKRAEAGIALASNLPDKSIVDPARQVSENPVFPNSTIVLLVSALAGLTIPIGLIIISHFLNDRIHDKRDLEKLTNLKVIATLSSFPKANHKLVVYHESPIFREAFRFLVINLKQLYNLDQNKVIGFSSSQQGEGKTFCAMNTAAIFASIGKKTLFVDADLLKLKKNNLLGNTQSNGHENRDLYHYLTTDIPWTNIIKSTPFKNLYTISSGYVDKKTINPIPSNEGKLDQLFHNLRSQFDIILVDTPPLTMVSDYFSLSKYFDINLLVVRYNNTERRLLEEIIPSIKLRELKNVGLIFNDVSITKMKEYGITPYGQR